MRSLYRALRRTLYLFLESRVLLTAVFSVALFLLLSWLLTIAERQDGKILDFWSGLWWGVVTFTTTGYGDIVPGTWMGRIIAAVMMFFGIALAGYIAGLAASLIVEGNSKARRGLMDYLGMSGHMIICGWKEHILSILLDIVSISEEFPSENIILISNVDPEKVEALREQKVLSGLRFVRGDFFSESTLQRANVTKAAKVLVLADTVESLSSTEVDSKTVMTVMSIKTMARDVYVYAELINQKYLGNLKAASCDEIFLIRDLTRKLLTNTSVISGMSHIMYSIIDRQGGSAKIATPVIAAAWIGRSFQELRNHFLEDHRKILIGVLENSGNPQKMKMDALREAQKTSEVSQLISNLAKVKSIEINKPVLLPDDDYVLPRHARAILLERT